MNIKAGKTEIITTSVVEHQYFEVLKGVYAFKLETNTTTNHADIDDITVTQQGITNRSGITLLRKGLLPKPLGNANLQGIFVCPSHLLEEVRRFGYLAMSARGFQGFDDTAVYDWLVSGGSVANVVSFKSYDHSFWNLDGSLLPTGILFDYQEARFHNKVYDLPKAVKHLNKRGDVTFFDPERSQHGKTIMDTVSSTGEVADVPYYNRASGRTAFLSFVWTPNQQQAERLYRDKQNRFKTVFDDDMLGLRAAGAALSNDYYAEYSRTGHECECSCSCN